MYVLCAVEAGVCFSLVVVLCVVCQFILRGRTCILFRGIDYFCHFSISRALPRDFFFSYFFLKMDLVLNKLMINFQSGQ